MFFDLIQIELIHWLKHFKDKEESLHACFFASPPVESSTVCSENYCPIGF